MLSSAKREKEEVVGDTASNEKTEPELVKGKAPYRKNLGLLRIHMNYYEFLIIPTKH